MDTSALKQKIEGLHASALLQCVNFGKGQEGCAWIETSKLKKVCQTLFEGEAQGFDWLENLCAMQMDEVIVLTYFLRSSRHAETVILRASVPIKSAEERVAFPSLTDVWASAAPFEQEIAELFGARFLDGDKKSSDENQLLPRGFLGFPLRKTFQFQEKVETPDVGDVL